MDVLTSEIPPKADVVPDRSAGATARSRVPTALAVVIFAVVAGLGVWYIHRFAVNMIYFDQWTDIGLIQRAHSGTLTLGALWAQHNENRVFFPNLVVLALAYTTHFDIVVEDYICGALLGSAAALLIVAHKRRSPSLSWLAYAPVALVLVGYVPLADALFGYQIGWFLVLVGLAGSLFCLDRQVPSQLAMAGAIAFGVVGSFSAIEGLFIWPVGLVLLFLRRRSLRAMAVWTVAGVVAGVL
ncbi:MAG TPA: hypothetical protein VHW93_02865, partial [Acidimicrobiales bacterium]|nr:hypothetical protein [Acidimicrobiales bacterium]